MSAPFRTIRPLTREEYFALEQSTGERHEMIEGVGYAMVGGAAAHNIVAMNLAALVHGAKGSGCHVFQQGMKLRVATDLDETFFYPDVMLCCDPADSHPLFRERPAFIAEVLSPSTEQNDWGVKQILYRSIESLQEYLVLGASAAEVTIYRRSAGWRPLEVDLDAGITLESCPVRLDFNMLYDGVTF